MSLECKDNGGVQTEARKAMSLFKHQHTLKERLQRLRHNRHSSKDAVKKSKMMPAGEAAQRAAPRREVTFGHGLHNDRGSSRGSSFDSEDEQDDENSDIADLVQLPGRRSSQEI